MKRLLIAMALLGAGSSAHAGITGSVSDCSGPRCVGVARLQLNPTPADTQGQRSLFVGLFQMVNGQPEPTVGGWFNGQGWQKGMPVAAWTGQLSGPMPATVRIPGGVCGLAKYAGGPRAVYGLYAGWGKPTEVQGGLDVADTEAAIREADPETAALLRKQLSDYQAAIAHAQQTLQANGASAAFTEMRMSQTYWLIKTFDCTNNTSSGGTPGTGTGGGGNKNTNDRTQQN